MTTQCVVRAAERPSAAARELAPAVANLHKTIGYIPDVTKITETLNLTVTVNGVLKNYQLIYSK